jgi:hypothetical protein
MIIAIVGNPVEGFDYYGPFDDMGTAVEWCEDMIVTGDWWVSLVESPASFNYMEN